jgi:UDP-2,3-diacylglucosamine hydrolase
MKTSLIISDLHLTNVEKDKIDFFANFCKKYASKADQLFILGDLFNTWIGDDLSLVSYKEIINTLRDLSKDTKVFVMAGNRDFLLSKQFELKSGCKLIREPYTLEHNANKFLLIHGDSLCTDDINYQKLKRILRNPITQFIFLKLSKNIRLKLTGQLRNKSIEAQKYKTEELMDVNQETTDLLMSNYSGFDLIHGHTHRQKTHIEKEYTRYVLGDWSNAKGNAIKITDKLEWLEIN